MLVQFAYLHLTLAHSKGEGHTHFSVNIFEIMTDMADIAIAIKL